MLFLIYGAIGAILAGASSFAVNRSFVASAQIAGFAFVVLGLAGWLLMPTLAWNFGGVWWFVIASAAIGAGLGWFTPGDKSVWATSLPFFIAIIGVVLAFVTTTPMFHAADYRKLLGPVAESRFTDDVSPVDLRQVRIVDSALAHNIGQKRLGEIPGLGSRVELGAMNIQLLDGCFTIREYDGSVRELCFDDEFMWAGPLIHDGFLRWFSHDVTPGYVVVSATDASKVYMVTSVAPTGVSALPDGGLRLRYLRAGAYFGDDLQRHLRSNGFVSAGADDGTVGFVLVDTRTKKVRWYRMPGAMETSAQSAAENARGVREAGFEATFPVLYNIGGIPTYLTTLKGDDGLVKMFGFVSAQNLMVVGVDSTIQDALRNYQNSLQQQGRTLVADDLVKQQRLEAEVLAIARERRGDIEYYYLILKGREDTEFYAAPELSPELKWTRVGDTVAIDFDEGKLRSVLINTFDNPRLALVMAP